jgi:Co/Zn/Cd efflux system component
MVDGGARAHLKDNIVLVGALAANLGIAVAKFIAAGISGSSSMVTEGVHSLVDSGNQILLLYGQSRAKKPPDRSHPFGYGRELDFWAFVVAILIFAVGSGVSIYEGIMHLRAPEPPGDPLLNYVVLAVAFALEGTSWVIAVREFDAGRGQASWWKSIKRSKDPAGFMVLFEDSAALIGLVLAAAGVWLSNRYDNARFDGMSSDRHRRGARRRGRPAGARGERPAHRRKCRPRVDRAAAPGGRGAAGDHCCQSRPNDPHRARFGVRRDQCRFRRQPADG